MADNIFDIKKQLAALNKTFKNKFPTDEGGKPTSDVDKLKIENTFMGIDWEIGHYFTSTEEDANITIRGLERLKKSGVVCLQILNSRCSATG
ncbi:MAG: hypothetical protein LBD72_01760 [Puniceicoccales bacterium]|nr:hypothetical protein [Puniceicoccales bacterium]